MRTIQVLILEDDNQRIREFSKRFLEAKTEDLFFAVTFATTAEDAFAKFREKNFDMIFIDHDLCVEHYDGEHTEEKTGYDFAKAIASSVQESMILISHSLNPEGRKNICNAFANENKKCYEMPFAWKAEKFRLIRF